MLFSLLQTLFKHTYCINPALISLFHSSVSAAGKYSDRDAVLCKSSIFCSDFYRILCYSVKKEAILHMGGEHNENSYYHRT